MRNFIFLIFLFPVIAIPKDRVVAFVGNKVILESEIKERMEKSRKVFDEVLKDLIKEKLLIVKAEKENINVEKEEVEREIERIKKRFPDENTFLLALKKEGLTYSEFENMVEERIKIGKLLESEVKRKIKISIFEIAEEMERIKKHGKIKEVFLKKISFERKKEAEEFAEKWKKDREKEMEVIGWVKIDELIPELREKIERLEENCITQPIFLEGKYHIFLLKKVKKVKIPEDEMAEIARRNIYERKYKQLFNQFIENLKKEIPIKINE